MNQLWIWTLASYLILMPLSIVGINSLYKYLFITRKVEKARKKRIPASKINTPEPPLRKWMERFKFTTKDQRPLTFGKGEGGEPKVSFSQRRIIALSLYLIGLLLSILPIVLSSMWPILLLISFSFFYTFFIFSVKSADKPVSTRNKVIERMFNIGKSKLQIPSDMSPYSAVKVTEWKDVVKPNKAELFIPDEFGEEGSESFLKQFNQVFGRETAWVPDNVAPTESNPDGQIGWDFDEQVVRLRAVPPLPRMAPWSEHYVLNENIAWSFFPIALGVEDGVELPNPETGKVENVLGFDLSGEQGKKKGVTTSPTITTSPMVYIGGGTGGGKSLSEDTIITVLED